MPSHPVQPPEWIDSAPVLVEETIDIKASPATVWAFIADHTGWTEWFTDLDNVEVTGSPTGVGGNRRVTAKPLTIDEEFTAWDENERFAFAVIKSRVPFLGTMAEDVQLTATDDGCHVVYRQGLQGKRGFDWLIKLAWKKAPGQLRNALSNLKALAEKSNLE